MIGTARFIAGVTRNDSSPFLVIKRDVELFFQMLFSKTHLSALLSLVAHSERWRWFAITLFCGLLLSACSGGSKSGGPPTEAQIKAAIEKDFKETYGVDYGGAKFDKVTITFPGSPQIGASVNKQMGRGEEARPVWPVKVPVKIKVTYSNNSTVRDLDRGVKSDDVFFFYKDSFDAWNFRTGYNLRREAGGAWRIVCCTAYEEVGVRQRMG